jgi:hypothetical protein
MRRLRSGERASRKTQNQRYFWEQGVAMTIIPVDTIGSVRDVFDEIVRERIVQDEKWGGPTHDDTHTQFDWTRFIREHVDRSVRGQARDDFRKQMVRVAALAVAAVQSFDRIGKKQMVHGKRELKG